ncbi:hypothetical protein [Candidatus Pelagibacter sp. Uisw_136]|jgi:hypothetical protein|uniref:hypothetical protein n=1 Tax=Candidatus Pelagibacter sp. Uisw_136 TaxID=3230991 RepID=UPI0039EB052F
MANKKKIKNKKPNLGFEYEDRIIEILKKKKLISEDYKRTGGSDKADIIVNYKKQEIITELKDKNTGADYGQKELNWSHDKLWSWSLGKSKTEDATVKLFKGLKIIENYINKDFIPRKYSKKKDIKDKIKSVYEDITVEDYRYDLKHMEMDNIPIPLDTLFEYYAIKKCFYIQIENSGFYHLQKDKFEIGTKQFDGEICLRTRAKYRKSRDDIAVEPWQYGLLAKIKLKKKPTQSHFDIQELDGRKFPFKD